MYIQSNSFALDVIKDTLIFLASGSIDRNVGGCLYPLQTIASMTLQLYRRIFRPRCCYDYYD
jgi:hypothetical protein